MSCASRKYVGTRKCEINNTAYITCNNIDEFKVCVYSKNLAVEKLSESIVVIRKYKKSELPSTSTNSALVKPFANQVELRLSGFKLKGPEVYLDNSKYESVHFNIDRRVRYDALSKDIALGLVSFGVPLIIDAFKSDFYKVKSESIDHSVQFEFKQSYMKQEYNKIVKSKDPADFSAYVSKYPKSEVLQKAADKRDSLELSIAVTAANEAAIDKYISTHQLSRFLPEAQKIKSEMVAAREMFTSSKITNSVQAYEDFLAKYPKSLHNTEAHQRLVDAAETEALNSNSSQKMESYIKQFLIPNNEFLGSEINSAKIAKISSAIDQQIIIENISSDPNKVYSDYSSLWKRYQEVQSNVPTSYLRKLEQTAAYKAKICDVIFSKLKEANTKEKQASLCENLQKDFNGLNESPDKNVLLTVLMNVTNSSGNIKLYNTSFLKYRISKSWNFKDKMNKRDQYTYKANNYQALENIDYEELSFQNGKLNGTSKSFSQGKQSFQILMNLRNEEVTNSYNKKEILTYPEPKEISYFQEGKLVKTIYFFPTCSNCIPDFDTYEYEFENGVNNTLKALDQKIAEGNSYLKAANYDMAISTLEEARKNKFPATLSQNILIDKNITNAKNQQAAYLKKEEEKRIAEEEKRRKSEMTGDKFISQQLSKYTWVTSDWANRVNIYMNFYPDNFNTSSGKIITWNSNYTCGSFTYFKLSNENIKVNSFENCVSQGIYPKMTYDSTSNSIKMFLDGKTYYFNAIAFKEK